MTTFVDVPAGSDFPIQNLPYGVFSTAGNVSRMKYSYKQIYNSNILFLKATRRIGVAIGGKILDLSAVATFYPDNVQQALRAELLNPLMELGHEAWDVVRSVTRNLLLVGSPLDKSKDLQEK